MRALAPTLLILLLSAPAAAQTGGPNAFGYTFGPATYDYVSPPGSVAPLAMLDDSLIAVTLPWDFPFYGADYPTVYVSDNGGINFNNPFAVDYFNECLPPVNATAPEVSIYWEDLSASVGGSAYAWHDEDSDRFIIAWENYAQFYSDPATYDGGTFQIHLHPGGAIQMHWADTTFDNPLYSDAGDATIGILDPLLADPLEFSCMTASSLEGTATVFATCDDLDGDSYGDTACGGTDCDDTDDTIHPGAQEVCSDGVDQDCDGADLDGDLDLDGYESLDCVDGDDCDDTDPDLSPGVDLDGDGANACIDCNDNFDFISPLLPEICDDAIDNDCNGEDATGDEDGDGYLNADCEGTDCDDTDPAVHPGVDDDGDGFDVCQDCDDAEVAVHNGAEEVCDGLDNDCNDAADDVDEDGDGDPPVACGGTDCDDTDPAVGAGTDADADGYDACVDCDDGDDTVFPGAAELCDDVDSDCDGLLDGLDPDVGAIPGTPLNAVGGGLTINGFGVVSTSVPVVGGNTVTDVNLGLEGSYDPVGELIVRLISPSGTAVTVLDTVGEPQPPNFGWTGTVLDDEAATSLEDAAPPYTGSYLPSEPLSAFDGEASDGVWTLEIEALGIWWGFGSLTSWTLDIEVMTLDDADGDGWVACGDCAPNDATIHPDAEEVCGDALDQDCDGFDLDVDLDEDGYQDIACGGDDCDDADPALNPGIDEDGDGSSLCDDCDDDDPDLFPGNPEVCGDGLDQDCSGADDEGDADGDGFLNEICIGGNDCDDEDPLLNPGVDGDGDGLSSCDDCDDADPQVFPGNPEVCGDGLDNNCDGGVDDVDADADGFLSLLCGGEDCDDADPTISPEVDADEDGSHACLDCDDLDADRFPANEELCADGVDQDCDGVDLSADLDGDGYDAVDCGGDDCDDTDPEAWPGAPELCDGRDTNCDGLLTDIDEDLDGWPSDACGGGDCNDDLNFIHPGQPELCNAVDDNCDGVLYTANGGEADTDGDGQPLCDGDCDDNDITVNRDADEVCDGIDNDCDDFADEGHVPDGDLDGVLNPDCGGEDCDDGDAEVFPDATEVCTDGLDNDCDGATDRDDTTCGGGTEDTACADCSSNLGGGDATGLSLLLLVGLRRRRR